MTPSLTQRFSTDKPDVRELCSALRKMESAEDVEALLTDLCTRQELKVIGDRWCIAKLMHMGFPYRVISNKTGASSSTIARIAQSFSSGTGRLMRACKQREEQLARELSA